jgi:hypothetical protein
MSKTRRQRRHRREGDSLTIKEFCRKHDIGKSTYYKLRADGDGPAEMLIGGTVRISARANSEWEARKEAAGAARLPVFSPKSPGRDEESRDDNTVPARPKKRSKKRGCEPASESAHRGDDTDCDDNGTGPQQQKGPSNERSRDAASEPSRSDKRRDNDKTSPRRDKERSKERGQGEKRCDDDKTVRQWRTERSKKRHRRRSKKARLEDGEAGPQLDIAELKRRLKRGKRLPKDALIESSRWRLDSNCYRKRDQRIERTMLRALTGTGSSEAEQRQALEQANCTRDTPCRRLMCWLCKHRAWFRLRRELADMLGHDVPHDHISWVTVVIDVCDASPKALRGPMSQFRSWLTKAADEWNVVFFGRFEVDLLLDPLVLDTTRFKRETLLWLGLDPKGSEPVAVFHVHLIAYHPDKARWLLSVPLKQSFQGPRQTQIKPFFINQSQTEALDNLTRYPLKSLPPKGALFKGASRFCRPRDPKALRLYNKLAVFLDGENGECITKPTVTPEST